MKKILLSLAAATMCLSANAAWYLVGSFNSWDVANAPEMTEVEPGYFQYDLPEMKSGFKIVSVQSWQGGDAYLGAAVDEGVVINSEEGFALSNGGGDISFKDCDKIKDATIGLVVEGETYTLYVRGTIDTDLPTIYLPGSWAQAESDPNRMWATNDETMMTQDGTLFTKVYTLKADRYEFKVCGEGWSPQWAWYDGSQAPLSLENSTVALDKKEGSDPGNVAVQLNEDGDYTFIFDYTNATMTLTKGSGIESIDVDNNVAPVYYNLQGVRVNNPENGLFIKVAGKNVSKVVL